MNPKVQFFPPYLNVAKIGMCPTIVAGQVVVMTHDVVAYTHHSLQNKCNGEEENSKVSSQAFLRMLLMSPVLLLAQRATVCGKTWVLISLRSLVYLSHFCLLMVSCLCLHKIDILKKSIKYNF